MVAITYNGWLHEHLVQLQTLINTRKMIEFNVKYKAKYRLKNNTNYIFSTCSLCFNQKSGRLVKQITKKYTIGYLMCPRIPRTLGSLERGGIGKIKLIIN